MTVEKQLIEKVEQIKTTLNEISVYNLDVKTSLELYYELARKVNEVITELSRFEGVVSEEVIKQNEKLLYLLGEGLKEQVGIKIDELITNGTIQDLINNKIFNDLNNKIDTFKQQIDEEFNTVVKVEKIKKGIENKDYNTSLLQNIIDNNYANNTTSVDNAPITLPYGGIKILIPKGEYYVGNLYIGDGITLEGEGKSSTILLTDGLRYKKYSQNGFQACWNININKLTIKGINGNEILIGTSQYTTEGRMEHIVTEMCFNDVILDHGNIGLDLRGWNNRFNQVMFRDLNIGLNMDTAKMFDKSVTANCGDNIFSGCTFNNCDIDIKMRYSHSNMFIGCAGYQSDNVHVLIGEECRGNQFIGGRFEDSPNALVIIHGGNVVQFNGKSYQCIKSHTSSSSIQPTDSTYWRETSSWTGYKEWQSGVNYLPTSAINNIFNGVNCYIGKESRKGRNNKIINRSATFKYFKLEGDQYSKVENCFSGSYTDNKIYITKNSVNGEFKGNQSITVENEGSTSFYEEKFTYGNKYKEINSPVQYNEKINLVKNKFIVKLKQWSTNTPVMVNNNSATDVVLITPRNTQASTFYGANVGSIYAICEANDKIRIYHPQPSTDDMEFNVIIL